MLAGIPDPQPGSAANRMNHCIDIATEVESETFRIASSQVQYYDIMVKRCMFIAKDRGENYLNSIFILLKGFYSQ